MKARHLTGLLLTLALGFTLAACSPSEAGPSASPSVSPAPSAQSTADQARDTVRLAVLSGPTGVGAAKLIADSQAGTTANDYVYTIANDNNELVAGLTGSSPSFDIATVASNVAVNLYNRTDGEVKIIALGTRGVLHILESGGNETVQSVADLAGKTIYATGQGANPEYILRYLLERNGLDPDTDVNLVFAEPAEITQRLITGEAEVAMLPVPAATAAILQGEGQIRQAIDVTQAWEEMDSGSQLIMTAVVARTQFLEDNPEAVAAFLSEYEASIQYVNDNPEEMAQTIADLGITPSAAIAQQAIPQCHLVYIDGSDMISAISDYFMVLYSIDPASVGGSLPDDAIYYVP
ncbi:MAG TPA: ABC transporter substrate-binding protein [Candidatus Enterenecus merdae]|nr:ABC transporter substrate-binding protein [Candidatus Enterenecus merdae]